MAGEPTTPESATIVNWDEALNIVGGKQELLHELVEIFLREGPRLFDEAQRAHAAGDVTALRIAAHTLKGSARYFGAQAVVAPAFEAEQSAGRGDLAAAAAPLARLAGALDQLLPELRAYHARSARDARSSGTAE